MFQRVHSATILVRDQKAALAFYSGVLGWEVRMDHPTPEMRFLTVAPEGSDAEIFLVEPGTIGKEPSAIGGNLGLTIEVTDLRALHAELAAKGVPFSVPPVRLPWGDLGCHMEDPDGNSLFLREISGR